MDVETEAIATTATKNMIPLAPRHIAHLKVSWRKLKQNVGRLNDDHAANFAVPG